ncbi:MAG: 4-hydroxy-3-methylbut-2-enyl diphosphate reductase [bacterium]
MKIIFAKYIGFCSGVKRAILIANKSLENDKKPINFLGSLVHNEKVIEKFKKEGVKFIKSPKEAKSGTLIIQAHGFPPFSKKITVRDATCPLVKKVQLAANSFYKQGFQVIIAGDKKHDEVKGIKGYTKNKALIIEGKEEVKKLSKFKKIGLVAQTTQSAKTYKTILEALKKKAGQFKWLNTLCPEVISRQKELDRILERCDGILVIGSRSSANTKRLAEKAERLKKKIFWINSLKELKKINFQNISYLGVVSGTSAPDWEIKKIKKWLTVK